MLCILYLGSNCQDVFKSILQIGSLLPECHWGICLFSEVTCQRLTLGTSVLPISSWMAFILSGTGSIHHENFWEKTTPVCGEGAMHQAFHVYYHLMFTVTEVSFHRHYSSRGRQSQLDPAEAGFELGVVSPEPWFHFVTSSTGVYLRKTLWQPKLQTLRDPGSSRSIVLAQSLNTLALNPESAKETHPGSGTWAGERNIYPWAQRQGKTPWPWNQSQRNTLCS